jgi:two-component system sensor histidine kinase KdpD
VLVNLLDNADKYSPAGSPIEVAARELGGTVEVCVRDRGPGLPVGERGRLFEKFFQGSNARRGGVGLGLAICRTIVEAHGGKIWVEDRPGGGTIFRFTLRTVEVEEAEHAG